MYKHSRVISSLSAVSTVICILSLACCVSFVRGNDCADNNINITNCLIEVKDLQQSHDLAKYWQEAELNKVCKNIDDAGKCLIRHNCEEDKSHHLVEKWKGVKNSFKYICVSGRADYLAQAQCWSSADASQKLGACRTTHLAEFDKQPSEVKCTKLNSYISCVGTEVAAICNEEASVVMKKFAVKHIKPQAELFGCTIDFKDEESNQTPPMYASISVVLLSILLPLLLSIH